MSPYPRTLAIILALGLVPMAFAHEAHDDHGKAIEYRTALMDVFAWNLKSMMAMAKGKRPFDSERFRRHARDLHRATRLDLLAGFPEDSDEGDDTDARPDIWLDWETFVGKYRGLVKAAGALETAAAGGDRAAMKHALQDTAKACKSCHKAFRE